MLQGLHLSLTLKLVQQLLVPKIFFCSTCFYIQTKGTKITVLYRCCLIRAYAMMWVITFSILAEMIKCF